MTGMQHVSRAPCLSSSCSSCPFRGWSPCHADLHFGVRQAVPCVLTAHCAVAFLALMMSSGQPLRRWGTALGERVAQTFRRPAADGRAALIALLWRRLGVPLRPGRLRAADWQAQEQRLAQAG